MVACNKKLNLNKIGLNKEDISSNLPGFRAPKLSSSQLSTQLHTDGEIEAEATGPPSSEASCPAGRIAHKAVNITALP